AHLLVLAAVPVTRSVLEPGLTLLGPGPVPVTVVAPRATRSPAGAAHEEDRADDEQLEQEEPEREEPVPVSVPADHLDYLVRGGGAPDPLVHACVVGADPDPDHRQDHQDRRRDRPSASHVAASF